MSFFQAFFFSFLFIFLSTLAISSFSSVVCLGVKLSMHCNLSLYCFKHSYRCVWAFQNFLQWRNIFSLGLFLDSAAIALCVRGFSSRVLGIISSTSPKIVCFSCSYLCFLILHITRLATWQFSVLWLCFFQCLSQADECWFFIVFSVSYLYLFYKLVSHNLFKCFACYLARVYGWCTSD